MGGSHYYSKGNGNGSSSNSSRGRKYGLMLVMAFGAALFGVMVLHKLKERRIFNLLLKEKDDELVSLQLLLQKDRDYTKELKRKNEEMKTKLYSMRTQKMELDRSVSELKSTIGSLKEELQTMEAAFEEKQSEIKILKVNAENESPQEMEMLESLRQKEAEIQDLKHRLEYPVKVWSVSSDDPSKPATNLTLSGSAVQKADGLAESTSNKDSEQTRPGEDGSGNKVINLGQANTTTEVEDQIGNGGSEPDKRETMVKPSEKLKNTQDRSMGKGGTEALGQGKTDEDWKGGGGLGIDAIQSNVANASQAISDTNGKDTDHKVTDGEEIKITGNGQVRNAKDFEHDESQKLQLTAEGGMKLEMQDNSDNSDKPKKWRLIAKQRRLEIKENLINNGLRDLERRSFKDNQKGLIGRAEDTASNRRLTGDNHPMEDVKRALDKSKANGESRGITNNDMKQKQEDGKSEDEEAINIQQQNLNTSAEQEISFDPQDLPEDLEVAEAEEQEKDAIDDNIFDESGLNSEEDREEYREELDESEF